jgi:hypothetical protein
VCSGIVLVSAQNRRARKGWLLYLGVLAAFLSLLVGTIYAYLFVHIVPPVSGTVVDAVTGRPIGAIRACLRVDAEALGHSEVLRTETVKTDNSGKFAFRPSVYDLSMLTQWRGYSVRLTDPQNDMAAPCGPELGPGLSETHPDQAIRVKGYFPVALVEPIRAAKSNLAWSSTTRPMGPRSGMKILLLPVLTVPDECSRVTSQQLANDCRQLVTGILATFR